MTNSKELIERFHFKYDEMCGTSTIEQASNGEYVLHQDHLDLLEQKEKEVQRLVGFVDEMIEVAFDGADTDGWAIQESAENHGLLVPQKRTEPCGENCRCIDYVFPVVCFRKTYKP